tara:strand:+ start:252 stop:521 length:270 start_codon:yes stop_codon:yes gene_type:complete
MSLWELLSEKLFRVTLNPLALFKARGFVGECLCFLRITGLPNSGSPPAIPLNEGCHTFFLTGTRVAQVRNLIPVENYQVSEKNGGSDKT